MAVKGDAAGWPEVAAGLPLGAAWFDGVSLPAGCAGGVGTGVMEAGGVGGTVGVAWITAGCG